MPFLLQWHTRTPAGALTLRLLAGDRQFRLYGLRSFVIMDHMVQVLLEPRTELRIICTAWEVKRCRHRWVPAPRLAGVIRQMENLPVRAGLAQRPEQWPWSSAWED